MCLSGEERRRRSYVVGAAFTKLLQRFKKTCVLESVTGVLTAVPLPSPFSAARKENSSFPSKLLSYSWHGQFPFAKKIFSLIKEIRKSDD